MKRSIIYIALTLASLLGVSSCNMISYDGPYNQDGYFSGDRSAYFFFQAPKDTLQAYSFSLRPASETEHTFTIKVKVMGEPASTPTRIGVSIIPEETNAVENVHYTPIPAYVEIPANALEGELKVTMLRANLEKQKNEKRRIVLMLTPTNDLKVVGGERNSVILSADDYFDDLELSQYWDSTFSPILGMYDRRVYMKFLESYNWDEELLWSEFFGPTRFWTNWAMTVRYFETHPELGVDIVLPDWMKGYLPYQD